MSATPPSPPPPTALLTPTRRCGGRRKSGAAAERPPGQSVLGPRCRSNQGLWCGWTPACRSGSFSGRRVRAWPGSNGCRRRFRASASPWCVGTGGSRTRAVPQGQTADERQQPICHRYTTELVSTPRPKRTKRRKKRYDPGMERLHISEGDLAKDVQSILKRVETGAEVIVERDAQPVAVIRPAEPVRRKISECIALLPADSTATIDPDFAKDVEAAIAAHREPLEPPAWD